AEILTTYRELIALRRRVPDLSDPRLDDVDVSADDAYAVIRRGRCLVIANFGAEPLRVELPDTIGAILFSTSSNVAIATDALPLPGQAGAVLGTCPRAARRTGQWARRWSVGRYARDERRVDREPRILAVPVDLDIREAGAGDRGRGRSARVTTMVEPARQRREHALGSA